MTSPFLPGTRTQFAWDSTSLGWFKECPRKYQYNMIEGWRPNKESVHIRFGQHYHTALETYDRLRVEGLDHDDALIVVVQDALFQTWDTGPEGGQPWFSDHPSKTRENLIRSIIWYCDHFKEDAAETVILANGKPAVELSFKMELDWGPSAEQPYILCGHIDRLVNFTGGFYVSDRKTTGSTVASNYFDQYDPDNQMSLYTLAAKVIYKTPVRGVIIDAVQVAVGFSRFSRGFTYRTEPQINEWFNDLHHWFALAKDYAIAGYWPMNDKSCHNYGGCAFRGVCSKSPDVREKFLESDFHREQWNPLVPR